VVVGLLRPYSGDHVLAHYEVVIAIRDDDRAERMQLVTIDPGIRKGAGWRIRRWQDLDQEWRTADRPALVVTGPISSLGTHRASN